MSKFPALDRLQLDEIREAPAEDVWAAPEPAPLRKPVSLGSVGLVFHDWRANLPAPKSSRLCRAVDCSQPRLPGRSFCRSCEARFFVRMPLQFVPRRPIR